MMDLASKEVLYAKQQELDEAKKKLAWAESVNTKAVTVLKVKGKGRGLFAFRSFVGDELIEECLVLIFPGVPKALAAYVFAWGRDHSALALGLGSLLNHAVNANCYATMDRRRERISFWTARAIASGEELTINYGGEPGAKYKASFKVRP